MFIWFFLGPSHSVSKRRGGTVVRAPTWHWDTVWGGSLSSLRFAPPPAYVPNGDIAPSHRQHSTRHEGRRLRLTAQNGPSQTHQKTLSFLSPIWYSCGILNPRETVQVAASRSAVACARCSARNDRRCARSSFSRPAAASGSVR